MDKVITITLGELDGKFSHQIETSGKPTYIEQIFALEFAKAYLLKECFGGDKS